jgi:NAD(P)-dependent dehydrogenase (short-subunit alcohol dehydrogenase family)
MADRNQDTGMNLSGQTAVVIGGTRGIGWSICEALVRRGAKVLTCGSTTESVENAIESASDRMPELTVVRANACSEGDVSGLMEHARTLSGSFSCLVFCAGRSWRGSATQTTSGEWDRCLELNLRAPFIAARAAIPHLANVENANMVFVSSIWAVTATRNRLAYSVAKSGLAALARNLAIDHGPDGIRVNAIAPGYVDTELLRRSMRELSPDVDLMPTLVKRHPLRRIGVPSDVGEAVGFLASPSAGFITGHLLVVDGGVSAEFSLANIWS